MSFITVKNLNFKYPNGTENVLNDVSLEVTKGEKVAIIGQNGAGKTTMVKMLNGLLAYCVMVIKNMFVQSFLDLLQGLSILTTIKLCTILMDHTLVSTK